MSAPNIPDVACQVLRGVIETLASAGLMTSADADAIIKLLALENRFFDRDASLEIDRLTVENQRLRAGDIAR